MKLVNLVSSASREDLLATVKNQSLVNDKVRFDGKGGKPAMSVKETKRGIRVKCQFTDGSVRDNGFLEGTYFAGRITEYEGGSRLKGIIVTAPIYHSILAVIMVLFIYQCIYIGGFNPVPILWLAFSLIMFKSEFEKQGVIERYLKRAVQKASDLSVMSLTDKSR